MMQSQNTIPFPDLQSECVLSEFETQIILLRKSGLTLESIGLRIGKSQSYVFATLRKCVKKTGDYTIMHRFSAEQKAETKRKRSRENNKKYNARHPDRVKARRKRWEEKNCETRRAYNRRWKLNNKARHRETYIQWYSTPSKRLERLAKGRIWWARKSGIPFDEKALFRLSESPATRCEVCGIDLDYSMGMEARKAHKPMNGPSIDRIIPAIGYVEGNIAVLCNRCNVMKGMASAEEHRRFADFMENRTR